MYGATQGILFSLGGLLALGTWLCLWKHVGARRNKRHVFMDFMLAILLVGALVSLPHAPTMEHLRRDGPYARTLLVAAAAGALLALSNVFMQHAVQLLGLTLAPLLQASVVLVLCESRWRDRRTIMQTHA